MLYLTTICECFTYGNLTTLNRGPRDPEEGPTLIRELEDQRLQISPEAPSIYRSIQNSKSSFKPLNLNTGQD